MIRGKKKIPNKISFQKVSEDLNISVEKVLHHWNRFINGPDRELMKTNNNRQLYPVEVSLQSFDGPIERPLLKGEMLAKLVLPRKMVLFWDTSQIPNKLIQYYFNMKFADLVQVLRVYDVSQIDFNGKNHHHFYEITIPYHQGHWFVKGLLENRSYLAEIGFKLTDNQFFPLLRSNSVQTPKLETTFWKTNYHELVQLHQYEDRPSKWKDHVSTYRYYITADNDQKKND